MSTASDVTGSGRQLSATLRPLPVPTPPAAAVPQRRSGGGYPPATSVRHDRGTDHRRVPTSTPADSRSSA
ncbi:hypothetical protein PJI17_00735 [Mycobacterium kansasii]